jgi:hypothetical protein
MDNVDINIVAKLSKDGHTYQDIGRLLQEMFPHQRGFSARTVRRYCNQNGLEKMNNDEIDEVVDEAVMEVCTCTCIL